MRLSVSAKVCVAFLVCFAIFVVIFNHKLHQEESSVVTSAGQVLAKGILAKIDRQLTKMPLAKWPKIMNKEQYSHISIEPISSLKFTHYEMKSLSAGGLVLRGNGVYQFLNKIIGGTRAYKKIGKTNYVLDYAFSRPTLTVRNYMLPVLLDISKSLMASPLKRQSSEIDTLRANYDFPIHFYRTMKINLSLNVKKQLAHSDTAFSTAKNTARIDTIYFSSGDHILIVGPLNYPTFNGRVSDVLSYFVMALFILSFAAAVAFSFLFVRNMRRLVNTTNQFGKGEFTKRQRVGAASVLYDLSENINRMGDKLHVLMETNKNMSSYVAHEMRTPMYTMQMALDSINDSSTLPQSTREYISSIKEDIQQLNDLVKSFLLYSQGSSRRLEVHKEDLDLNAWLAEIVNRYQHFDPKIEYKSSESNPIKFSFDPKLLKHAVENLIVNAQKFARNKILVALVQFEHGVSICIDDDGVGIEPEDKQRIFEAFSTASVSGSNSGHIGLGLAIVKMIAHLHSGHISVEDSPLGGSQFVVFLNKKS